MAVEAAEKPAYLGLLNAISNAESAAGVYLEAWADVTPDEDLACTLRLVAARERSHGDVFCRRLSELGYTLIKKTNPKDYEQLAKYSNPNISDLDKLPPRSEGRGGDPFADIRKSMAAGDFDPMTQNLLTWYLAEEVDSGRRLSEAYECVRDKAGGGRKRPNLAAQMGPSADAEAIMACMTQGFAKLEKSLEKMAKAAAK